MHISPGTLQAAIASAATAAIVSPESILQACDWARVPIPARHYFLIYITTTDWHQDSVQYIVLGPSE